MNELRRRARQLRKNSTDAERALWQKIRFWQVDGFKFRRQQPLGQYIVDFVCLEKRLVIEIDGGQHAEDANYDSNRDAWLREQGFIVLRFWNNDVLKNTDGVMGVIVEKLKGTPYLNPSPQGGRRKTKNRKQSIQRWRSGNDRSPRI
jgi:very-short-patch-repair endonuclease